MSIDIRGKIYQEWVWKELVKLHDRKGGSICTYPYDCIEVIGTVNTKGLVEGKFKSNAKCNKLFPISPKFRFAIKICSENCDNVAEIIYRIMLFSTLYATRKCINFLFCIGYAINCPFLQYENSTYLLINIVTGPSLDRLVPDFTLTSRQTFEYIYSLLCGVIYLGVLPDSTHLGNITIHETHRPVIYEIGKWRIGFNDSISIIHIGYNKLYHCDNVHWEDIIVKNNISNQYKSKLEVIFTDESLNPYDRLFRMVALFAPDHQTNVINNSYEILKFHDTRIDQRLEYPVSERMTLATHVTPETGEPGLVPIPGISEPYSAPKPGTGQIHYTSFVNPETKKSVLAKTPVQTKKTTKQVSYQKQPIYEPYTNPHKTKTLLIEGPPPTEVIQQHQQVPHVNPSTGEKAMVYDPTKNKTLLKLVDNPNTGNTEIIEQEVSTAPIHQHELEEHVKPTGETLLVHEPSMTAIIPYQNEEKSKTALVQEPLEESLFPKVPKDEPFPTFPNVPAEEPELQLVPYVEQKTGKTVMVQQLVTPESKLIPLIDPVTQKTVFLPQSSVSQQQIVPYTSTKPTTYTDPNTGKSIVVHEPTTRTRRSKYSSCYFG